MIIYGITFKVCPHAEGKQCHAQGDIFPGRVRECLRKSSIEFKCVFMNLDICGEKESAIKGCVWRNPIASFLIFQSIPVRLLPSTPQFRLPMQESMEFVWRDRWMQIRITLNSTRESFLLVRKKMSIQQVAMWYCVIANKCENRIAG